MTADNTLPPPVIDTWWSRNWKWVVPVGCLLPLLLMGACVATIATVALASIRQSEPYRQSLLRAQTHPAVQAALGTPVGPKWWMTGQVNVENDDGTADLRIPIEGPRGEAMLVVSGRKREGIWTYSQMRVNFPDERSVDLLPPPSLEESPDRDPPADPAGAPLRTGA